MSSKKRCKDRNVALFDDAKFRIVSCEVLRVPLSSGGPATPFSPRSVVSMHSVSVSEITNAEYLFRKTDIALTDYALFTCLGVANWFDMGPCAASSIMYYRTPYIWHIFHGEAMDGEHELRWSKFMKKTQVFFLAEQIKWWMVFGKETKFDQFLQCSLIFVIEF